MHCIEKAHRRFFCDVPFLKIPAPNLFRNAFLTRLKILILKIRQAQRTVIIKSLYILNLHVL